MKKPNKDQNFPGFSKRFCSRRHLVTLTVITALMIIYFSLRSDTFFPSKIYSYLSKEDYEILLHENSFSAFLVFDSHRLKVGDAKQTLNSKVLTKLLHDTVNLRDCLNKTTLCQINLIFYADDQSRISPTTRLELAEGLAQYLNGSYYNEKQSVAPWHKFHSSHVRIVEVISRDQDVTALNELIMDVYIRNYRYFQVTLMSIGSDVMIEPSGGFMTKALDINRLQKVGLIEIRDETLRRTVGLFFSQVHIDVFGWAFDYRMLSLEQAVELCKLVYPNSNIVPGTPKRDQNLGSSLKEHDKLQTVSRHAELLTKEEINELRQLPLRYIEISTKQPCLRCKDELKKSRRVISMSLYGTDTRYTMGALRNAQLFPVVFPGWRLRYYIGSPGWKASLPPVEIRFKLAVLGAELVLVKGSLAKLAPMMWRFSIAEDDKVDEFIIRDCDSRLTSRDAVVVADWLKTNKSFHCVRDHPSHSMYEISGGLWGGRPKGLKKIFQGNLVKSMKSTGSGYVEDMNYLRSFVWPRVKGNDAYCHDSYSCRKYAASHPFPVKRRGLEHLGQVYDKWSVGRNIDMDIIRNTPVNPECVPS